MDRIRFALIGVGGFGLKRLKSILRNKDIAELRYIVDTDVEKVRSLSKEYGIQYITFDELLGKNDYDVTIIATPNAYHEELTIKLLDRGKDVWCEKPMTISIDSARRMVMKSLETGAILKVGSNPRYFPNVRRAIDLLKQGYVGDKVLFFRGWIGNEGLHLLSKDWYVKKDLIGGGTLLDNGVHLIDLIRYLVYEITSCYSCKLFNLKYNLEGLEDNAVVIYGLANDGFSIVHSSWTEKSWYMYFEIHGNNGYIHVDSRWSKAIIKYGKGGDNEPVIEDLSNYPRLSYDLELEDFIKDYKDGYHPKPTSYDGYRAVKVIMLTYLSATNTNMMPIKLLNNEDYELKSMFFKKFDVREAYIRIDGGQYE